MDILSLTVFILAFGGMVVIHELGHFITARWNGVEVDEFGIGLPCAGYLTHPPDILGIFGRNFVR